MKGLLAASRHLPRLYLPLIVMLCWAQNWRVITGGDDFWAHAAIGRWMVQHGTVPHETLNLWGASQSWIAHSWGTQLWFYEMLNFGGERGGAYLALAFACFMISLSFVLLWREWTRRGHISVLTLVFFLLGTACAATRARPRPELFSGVFFTILLVYLLREERADHNSQPQNRWRTAGIVAMFVLWANLHGQVAAGLLLLAVTAVCDAAQAGFQKADRQAALRGIALLGCCALAINLNPYGWHYWSALNPVVGPMFKQIDEWKPFWKTPELDIYFSASGLMLAFFALMSWMGTEKRRWAYGAWLLVWVALFLSARRHLWMLSLVSLAVLSVHVQAVGPPVFWQALRNIAWKGEAGTPIQPRPRAIARWIMIVLMVTVILNQAPSDWLHHLPDAVSKKLPVRAAAKLSQLNRQHPGLRVLNDYEYSSYLQWRCAGTPPLFIDLLNSYPDHLLFDYFAILRADPKGKKIMETRGVNCVFLRPYTTKDRPDKPKDSMANLAKYLDGNPSWQRIYKQNDATIWLKTR